MFPKDTTATSFTRLSIDMFIQIIREGSGTLFDPKLAKLFLECV